MEKPLAILGAHNSAVECHLHTVEVVGSNPCCAHHRNQRFTPFQFSKGAHNGHREGTKHHNILWPPRSSCRCLRTLPREQHIDDVALRLTLPFHTRVRVDLHRGRELGVAHQLLHHLGVVAALRQQRAVGVTESMPPDPLGDPGPFAQQAATPSATKKPPRPASSRRPHRLAKSQSESAVYRVTRRQDWSSSSVSASRGTGCCETSVLQSPTSPSETERSTLACPFTKSISAHFRPSVSLIRSPAVAQIIPIARSRSGSLPNSARRTPLRQSLGGC